jgi:DNA-binding NarL/FixJ family response regulator
VVLLDLNLPDGNGLVLAEQIRAERPGTCVLVCTSHDLPEYREAATLRGATHFLSKGSLDWVELGDLVEAAFRRSTTVC